jgi:hypothetical protein
MELFKENNEIQNTLIKLLINENIEVKVSEEDLKLIILHAPGDTLDKKIEGILNWYINLLNC